MSFSVQAVVDVTAGPAGVRQARTCTRQSLAHLDDDVVDTAVLLTNELVTNASLHVGGSIRLRLLTAPGLVRIEVEDSSPRGPVPRRELDRERTSGRGLHLLQQLGRAWGVEPRPRGKAVWCELDVAARTG